MIRRMLLFFLVLSVAPVFGQQTDPSILTLARLFGSTEFVSQTLGPVRWIDGGAGYTRLEPSATVKDGSDIVRYDVETGRREVLVSADRFVSRGSTTAFSIDNYTWSPCKKLLLV